MNFRIRLASFFVAALVLVQGLTAVFVYRVTRAELIVEGQRQLDVASRAFASQLDDLSNRVAASVQVLALDFALRSAIAQRDHDTVVSALRNHGKRVGATRMLLVDVDGACRGRHRGAVRAGRGVSVLRPHRARAPGARVGGRRLGRPCVLGGRGAGVRAGPGRVHRRGDSGRQPLARSPATTVRAAQAHRTGDARPRCALAHPRAGRRWR